MLVCRIVYMLEKRDFCRRRETYRSSSQPWPCPFSLPSTCRLRAAGHTIATRTRKQSTNTISSNPSVWQQCDLQCALGCQCSCGRGIRSSRIHHRAIAHVQAVSCDVLATNACTVEWVGGWPWESLDCRAWKNWRAPPGACWRSSSRENAKVNVKRTM